MAAKTAAAAELTAAAARIVAARLTESAAQTLLMICPPNMPEWRELSAAYEAAKAFRALAESVGTEEDYTRASVFIGEMAKGILLAAFPHLAA